MSVLTELELAEGDVLSYLERFGATPLRRVVRELSQPAGLVMMAVGALIREGLVRASRHELEVILEDVSARVKPHPRAVARG